MLLISTGVVTTVTRRALFFLVVGILLGWLPVLADEKTDVVWMKNGDRVTGEIKSLERGRVTLKTDAAFTLSIEWDEVTRLFSKKHLQLELETGERFFGTLDLDSKEGTVGVRSEEGNVELEMPTIVRIVPIEETRWGRLGGSLDLGFNFATANKAWQYTLASEVQQRSRKFLRGLSLTSTLVDQEDTESSRRQALEALVKRFLRKRRFVGGQVEFQENEELGLELRYLISLSVGRYAIQTSKMELILIGGLGQNWESFDISQLEQPNELDQGLDFVSTELIGSVGFALFKFDDPETEFRLSLSVYPSFSFSGRLRTEFDAQIRRESARDFFWTLSLYQSYDGKPPVEGLKTDSTVLSSAIGWSF
jgi:hypothetical protein